MGPILCFTLDTEPDDLWDQRGAPGFEHLPLLPEFHRALTAVGARPTYLTTSEVIEEPSGRAALEAILEAGNCEVGAHFHTWTRQWPFAVPDLGEPPLHALAHQLGPRIEGQMLAYTCEALSRALGIPPRSHRGGRFSLSPDTVANLVACGLTADSTVTPGQSWRDRGALALLEGPDFTLAPRHPYFLAVGEDILTPRARGEVLELPVGCAWTPPLLRRCHRPGLGGRIVGRLSRLGLAAGYTWLRPTLQSAGQLRRCLRQMKADGIPVWVAMIHSSEVIPCRHLPNKEAVGRFLQRCLGLVEDALGLGATGCTLQEAAERHRRTAG